MNTEIRYQLNKLFQVIGIDTPINIEYMVQFIQEDVEASSDYNINGNYTSTDILIGFRRFIETKTEEQ